MNDSTIAAIATPIGFGGVGIIKISGQKALKIVSHIFRKSYSSDFNKEDKNSADIFSSKTHHLYHGYIINPENRRVIDEVLIAFMQAPHSYTREDVVEIQAHSGPVVLRSILDLVLKYGAVIACPGEFTKRAYINGRIDLTQAEAVIDIINAKTKKSLEIATSLITKEMQLCVERISGSLFNFLAQINAAIDFPEDIEDIINVDRITDVIQNDIINRIKELIERYNNGHILRDGIKLAIVGKPNVGKSSLMNCLINKERSIVTAMPGTTRDLIEESFSLRGVPFIIADTAGLHETDDPVEVIGIDRAKSCIDCSDLALFIIDGSIALNHDDYKIFEIINRRTSILVINKLDLITDKNKVNLPDSWGKLPKVEISVLYNRGIGSLKDLVLKFSVGNNSLEPTPSVIPNLRHKLILDKCLVALYSAVKGLGYGLPLDLIAVDMQVAIDLLGEITGVSVNNDVLDHIFRNFCVGK